MKKNKYGHFIITSYSYSNRTRIAFDIVAPDNKQIAEHMEYLEQVCGDDVPVGWHYIKTNSPKWKSVVRYDPYFEDMKCISSIERFAELINKDRDLSAQNVANYIYVKTGYKGMKLKKAVFVARINYSFKGIGLLYDKGTADAVRAPDGFLARSRILFARNGIQKHASIDETIDKIMEGEIKL